MSEKIEKQVYDAEDLQTLLGIGRNKIYDFLEEVYQNQSPFRVIIAIQEINKGYQRQKTNQHSRKDESARKPEQYHAGVGVII